MLFVLSCCCKLFRIYLPVSRLSPLEQKQAKGHKERAEVIFPSRAPQPHLDFFIRKRGKGKREGLFFARTEWHRLKKQKKIAMRRMRRAEALRHARLVRRQQASRVHGVFRPPTVPKGARNLTGKFTKLCARLLQRKTLGAAIAARRN
jgi:hypothetical protein